MENLKGRPDLGGHVGASICSNLREWLKGGMKALSN